MRDWSAWWFKTFIGAILVVVFISANYIVSVSGPEEDILKAAQMKLSAVEEAKKQYQEELDALKKEYEEKKEQEKQYPLKNDSRMYAEVLTKMPQCTKVLDPEENEYYTCPDKSTITIVKWERNKGERKGKVIKYFNPEGTQLFQYGHPDDSF